MSADPPGDRVRCSFGGTSPWVDRAEAVRAFDDAVVLARAKATRTGVGQFFFATRPNGDALMIGIGFDLCVASFVAGNGEPPYPITVGDPDASGELTFDFRGVPTPHDRANGVSIDIARRILEHFAETGALLSKARWEDF